MNFSFHQLKMYCEVVQHKSITKAANALRLTQPALSIQLKNFQEQFELPLLNKKGRGIEITPYGMSIYSICIKLLEKANDIYFETEAYKNLEAGRLKIASVSSGKYIIPYLVADFMKKYPKIDLQISVTNKSDVNRALQESEIDFALVSVLPEKMEFIEEKLFENRLYLVGNSPTFDPASPLIYREPGSATRQAMDKYFQTTETSKSFELSTNEAVKQAVIAGLGISILPYIGIHKELERGELFILNKPGLPVVTHWRLIHNNAFKLSPLALNFLNFVKQNKNSIQEKHFN